MSTQLERKKAHKRSITIISILLSIAAIASTVARWFYKVSSKRAYEDKWKDNDDCGVA